MTNPTITPAMIEAAKDALIKGSLARIEQLEAALWPFAQYARAREHCWKNLADDNAHFGGKLPGDNLKIGDFRRASSAVVMQPPTRKEGDVNDPALNVRHDTSPGVRPGRSEEPRNEWLLIVARSIGRTMTKENHIERARDVWRSLVDNDLTIPEPTAINTTSPSPPGKEAEEIVAKMASIIIACQFEAQEQYRAEAVALVQSIIDERDQNSREWICRNTIISDYQRKVLHLENRIEEEAARAEAKIALAVKALRDLIAVAQKRIYPKPDVGPEHPYAVLTRAQQALAEMEKAK